MVEPGEKKLSIHEIPENELFELAALGNMDAREEIIVRNSNIARIYASNYSGRGVPYDDLYQEACFGLLIAINKFDSTRGVKFSAYATHYILKYIKKAIATQNANQPGACKEDFFYMLQAYLRIRRQYQDEFNREPTDEELCDIMDLPLTAVKRLRIQAVGLDAPAYDIDSMLSFSTSPGGGSNDRPVEDEVMGHLNILDIDDLSVRLTKREEEVIRRRMGFTEDGTPQTWQQLSSEMGYTIETLRLTYLSAINKYREAFKKKNQNQ